MYSCILKSLKYSALAIPVAVMYLPFPASSSHPSQLPAQLEQLDLMAREGLEML